MTASLDGCAPPAGGPSLIGRDVTREAVIQGTVIRQGHPVGSAYVRLLDLRGKFTAEVPTDADGGFRFFAGEGSWTLRVLAPRTPPVDVRTSAAVGSITEVEVAI